MAEASSIINFRGSISGLNFYRFNGKQVVRRAGGGFSGKAVLYGANHVRTREGLSEFGRCSQSGKLLRLSLSPLLMPKEYDWQPQQAMQLMIGLKKCDGISARGERSAAIGADTEEGRALLTGFTFNRGVAVNSVFKIPIVLDADGGGMTVAGFDAREAMRFPRAATHCRLSFGVLRFSFGAERGVVAYAEPLVVLRNAVVGEVHLAVDAVPGGDGLVLPFLKVEFLQMVNGEFYRFKARESGAFGILGVV